MNFIGIDLGLSALKIVLVNETGTIIAQERRSLETNSRHMGWAEQNPRDWWNAVEQALYALKKNHPAGLMNAAAMSVTAGAHIAVLCDEKAEPIRPAILWNDQRATAQADALRDSGVDIKISGNRASATWSLPQIMWLRENEPDLNIERIYFAKDWLRAQFTGDHMTDTGDACGAMLTDYNTEKWSDELCSKAGIMLKQLPEIMPCIGQAGHILPDIAATFGLPQNLVVAIGSIDTTAEWLCCGAPRSGARSVKLASAGVISMTATQQAPKPPISRYPHLDKELVYFAAGMNQCSTAVDWAARLFFPNKRVETLFEEASAAPIGANGVQFHPYLNGERAPLWRSDLTASFSQLTRASNRNDIARAVIEGISFAFRDIWLSFPDLSHGSSTEDGTIALIGGGTQSILWCQIIANILNQPCYVPKHYDAAYGAALIAAQAVNVRISDIIALTRDEDISRQIIPDPEAVSAYLALYDTFTTNRNLIYTCDK